MKTNKSKSIQLIIFSFLLFGFFSCQSTANSDAETKEVEATENQDIEITEEKKDIEVSFLISNIEDDINGNRSTISATINGENTELAKAANCNRVEEESYELMNIPTNAIWACACWWAGAGENFYAKKEGNKVEFYRNEIYEEMEEEGEWKLTKTLE